MSRLAVDLLVIMMLRMSMVRSAYDYHDYLFPCGPEDCSESVTCWNDTSERPLLNCPISEKDLSSTFDGQLECQVINRYYGRKGLHWGSTVLQRRAYNKPNFNFNRPWHDYETGFGSDDNYWIGLNRIHRLSSRGRNVLTIDVNINAGRPTKYFGFWVDDASSGYTVYAGPEYEKRYGQFEASTGQPFTAPDGGRPVEGCANEFKSGWWYGGVAMQKGGKQCPCNFCICELS